jgi:hypothetical protein
MMYDFIARTNWLNIKSNYFVNTIINFNLSYYTNVMITITFVNQPTLCRAFSLVPPKSYPHKSRAVFHINLYVLSIHTEVPDSTNKLYHMKRLAIVQNKPFAFPDSRMNHLCRYWNKRMLTIIQYTFCNHRAWWLPLIKERFIIDKSVTVFIVFFDLVWQTMLPTLIASFQQGMMLLWIRVVPPANSLLSKSMKHCSQRSSNRVKNANTGNHTLISQTHSFKENFYLSFFI